MAHEADMVATGSPIPTTGRYRTRHNSGAILNGHPDTSAWHHRQPPMQRSAVPTSPHERLMPLRASDGVKGLKNRLIPRRTVPLRSPVRPVNPLTHVYVGSNPTPSTKRKSAVVQAGVATSLVAPPSKTVPHVPVFVPTLAPKLAIASCRCPMTMWAYLMVMAIVLWPRIACRAGILPVACRKALAKAWRRSWQRNGTLARRAISAKLLEKLVYRMPSPCQNTYGEVACLFHLVNQ
jgi:hypothetical protein